MASSDLVFFIAVFAFLLAAAVVVYRVVWLRRAKTEAHLQAGDAEVRTTPDVAPMSGSPEWERHDPGR